MSMFSLMNLHTICNLRFDNHKVDLICYQNSLSSCEISFLCIQAFETMFKCYELYHLEL